MLISFVKKSLMFFVTAIQAKLVALQTECDDLRGRAQLYEDMAKTHTAVAHQFEVYFSPGNSNSISQFCAVKYFSLTNMTNFDSLGKFCHKTNTDNFLQYAKKIIFVIDFTFNIHFLTNVSYAVLTLIIHYKNLKLPEILF